MKSTDRGAFATASISSTNFLSLESVMASLEHSRFPRRGYDQLYVLDSKLFPNNSKQRPKIPGVFYRQSNRQTALQDSFLGSLPVQIETVMM
jgi:hypothetical protein